MQPDTATKPHSMRPTGQGIFGRTDAKPGNTRYWKPIGPATLVLPHCADRFEGRFPVWAGGPSKSFSSWPGGMPELIEGVAQHYNRRAQKTSELHRRSQVRDWYFADGLCHDTFPGPIRGTSAELSFGYPLHGQQNLDADGYWLGLCNNIADIDMYSIPQHKLIFCMLLSFSFTML